MSSASPAPKYDKHIFICVNERPDDSPKGSCARCGGPAIRERLLELIQAHGLKGKVRANKSHCLDVCELGPALVIYPDNIWYTGFTLADVDLIFNTSVLGNGVVAHLVATEATWEKLKSIRVRIKS